MRFIEKYSKAIINGSVKDDSFGKPVDDRPEIIPVTNPDYTRCAGRAVMVFAVK